MMTKSEASLSRSKFSNGNDKKTHCLRGHSLEDPTNVYIWYRKGRRARLCKACRRTERAARERIATPRPKLEAAAVRRLQDAWRDNEASPAELCGRFRIGKEELAAYVAGIKRESSVCSRKHKEAA